MLITCTIENHAITGACFEGEDLLFGFRLKSEVKSMAQEYEVLLSSLLEKHFGTVPEIHQAIIASVVPEMTTEFVSAISSLFDIEPLIVGPGTKTGLAIQVADPHAVGSNQIVNAVAVKEKYGTPAIVINFGTAITLNFLDQKGSFQGGIIAPGIGISANSLVDKTAKLPGVDLVWPETVLGKNTVTAMQSGLSYGYLCLIDGLVEQVQTETGPVDHIVATGSSGETFIARAKSKIIYDPHLSSEGLRYIAAMNMS